MRSKVTSKVEKSGVLKGRRLQSGRIVDEFSNEVAMTISSKCPDKWLFVDLETGDIWHVREGSKPDGFQRWRGANKQELAELRRATARKSDDMKAILSGLGGYALTCRKTNQDEWMEGLAEWLNKVSKALGDNRFYAVGFGGLFETDVPPKKSRS